MMTDQSRPLAKQRIQSVDILRGVIMLIMALDHTRDYMHHVAPGVDATNVATTTPILFFTRWITHFCAPNFVFLSGISAYLAGVRRTKSELSIFLIKRGIWLVLIEIVVMSFALTFNPFYNVIVLQVIWAIGFSMIILGLLIRAPLTVIGVLGGLIFFGHDVLDFVNLPKTGAGFVLIKMFFTAFGTVLPIGHNHLIFDLYAVIPWTGVMLLGYVFGSLYKSSFDPERRKKILLITGFSLVGLFLVLRFINVYGDPSQWSVQRNGVYTLLSFLDVSKYPPSLLFLCMTIGPALIALALTEHLKNKVTAVFITYGSVPFFYYILHFYLIRVINIILFFASGYSASQIKSGDSLFWFSPKDFGFSLAVVNLIWLFVIAALYFPCRWFSKYKKTHNQWWLSYL